MTQQSGDLHETLDIRTRLNLECGQVGWSEIERLFARGRVVYVAPQLDLIEVAALVAENATDPVKHWRNQGVVGVLSVEQAKAWQSCDLALWAVVVAPWVFVQARTRSH